MVLKEIAKGALAIVALLVAIVSALNGDWWLAGVCLFVALYGGLSK